MGVIFYFSSQSTTGVGGTNVVNRFLFFKILHLAEYGILAVLLFFGFKRYKWSILAGYLYAVSDELHQIFTPGRTPAFRDTLIDLFGILIGLFILRFLLRLKFFKKFFHRLVNLIVL